MIVSPKPQSLSKLLRELNSSKSGLTQGEALLRLRKYGPNELPEPTPPGVLSIFLSQFSSSLIFILMIAAAIVLYMGEIADGIIIFAVLIFNAVVGTIQEGKAQNTLRALRNFAQGSATVVRDGKALIVSDKEVVPGDLILLKEGEKIPADARLISINSLRADEAALTGESVPVMKSADDTSRTALYERRNAVFKGTNIIGGTGKAIVVATGLATEIGKISKELASIDADLPLKKNIAFLSRVIIIAVVAIGIIIITQGLIRGETFRLMFSTVVSLSVSIIPEGLPIVMTLVLASGVWRMSKQNVLVKKLQAVEGLGQARIIAVDKTGTITKNEMVLERIYIDRALYHVSGAGYEPRGSIQLEGKTIDPVNHPDLILAGRIAIFASNANAMYDERERLWKVAGDPTEAALGVFGQKIGFKEIDSESPKIFDIPFDYHSKFHLTIHKLDKKNFLSLVGAPEKVLSLTQSMWHSGKYQKLTPRDKEKLETIFLNLSRDGFRVLAFGFNENSSERVSGGRIPKIAFAGFYGIRDPLREEVQEAVNRAKEAGIRVVMITGDHKITAHSIARDAGIASDEDGVITGQELEELSPAELRERFATCNVFARITPEQKFKIIEIFKERGEVVAMTGDGVNDAPSLAAADLGVAMGKIGTEVAKEASDLVLLDDNFGNIISAVEEGRSIYKTIKKVVLYLFSTSVGEVLTISGAIFLGFPLPLLPAQIIWLNLVTDGFLDVSLAMEPKEDGLLDKNFKKPSKYILDWFSLRRLFFMGAVIAVGTLWVFSVYLGHHPEKALTVSLTALAAFQWFNAWNCKSETRSVFGANPFNNVALVGATIVIVLLQVFAVYNPLMQQLLHTVPLNLGDWILIMALAALILVLEELRKLASYWMLRRKSTPAV